MGGPSFGRYELRRPLGIGGMAEVFEAVAISEGGVERPVVIKRILEGYADDPGFREMFVDEVRILARLTHPNIVQVMDFGVIDDRWFIALELVRGADLGKVMAGAATRRLRIPQSVAVHIAVEVAKGLDHAHLLEGPDGEPLQLVHRDVSPSNILLALDGGVKLGDFGIAHFANRRRHTQVATVRGKPRYMAPEQVNDEPLDGRTDLFALGVVLYEMLTGAYPFDGRTDFEIVEAVRKSTPKPPSEFPGVSPELSTIVMKALARDRNQRHATGAELGSDLLEFLAPGAVSRLAAVVSLLAPEAGLRSSAPVGRPATKLNRVADSHGVATFKEEKQPDRPTGPAPLNAKTGETHVGGADVVNGRFKLEAELGRGGMGIVYRAVDLELAEPVALKLLPPQSAQDPETLERFKRETLATRRISHPNVIRIHDFGMSGEDAYISMELLEGGTLADRIAKGPIPISEAVPILGSICDGLAAAHEAGIVHRDLKPDNILFDQNGRPKLVDFGLARLASATTGTLSFAGTPTYMSPEQANGEEVGPWSDIYSLGVVFFEVFTGQVPFQSQSLVELAAMHTQSEPPIPRTLRPEIPLEIESTILQMLSKRPDRRYNSAARVASDLRSALARSHEREQRPRVPSPALPPAPPRPARPSPSRPSRTPVPREDPDATQQSLPAVDNTDPHPRRYDGHPTPAEMTDPIARRYSDPGNAPTASAPAALQAMVDEAPTAEGTVRITPPADDGATTQLPRRPGAPARADRPSARGSVSRPIPSVPKRRSRVPLLLVVLILLIGLAGPDLVELVQRLQGASPPASPLASPSPTAAFADSPEVSPSPATATSSEAR